MSSKTIVFAPSDEELKEVIDSWERYFQKQGRRAGNMSEGIVYTSHNIEKGVDYWIKSEISRGELFILEEGRERTDKSDQEYIQLESCFPIKDPKEFVAYWERRNLPGKKLLLPVSEKENFTQPFYRSLLVEFHEEIQEGVFYIQ